MTSLLTILNTAVILFWIYKAWQESIVKIYVIPGGQMFEYKTDGAAGADVHLRSIVSSNEMENAAPGVPLLRKTLFDFRSKESDPRVSAHIVEENGEFAYQLNPGEEVLGSTGLITEMNKALFFWATPRGGLSTVYGITVTNAPATIDSDYRGEAGILIKNTGQKPFLLKHGMRIAQVVFSKCIIPRRVQVKSYLELTPTNRGAGSFGSTKI